MPARGPFVTKVVEPQAETSLKAHRLHGWYGQRGGSKRQPRQRRRHRQAGSAKAASQTVRVQAQRATAGRHRIRACAACIAAVHAAQGAQPSPGAAASSLTKRKFCSSTGAHAWPGRRSSAHAPAAPSSMSSPAQHGRPTRRCCGACVAAQRPRATATQLCPGVSDAAGRTRSCRA